MNELSTDLKICGLYFGMLFFMGVLLVQGNKFVGEDMETRQMATEKMTAYKTDAVLTIEPVDEMNGAIDILQIGTSEAFLIKGIPYAVTAQNRHRIWFALANQ